MKVIKNRNVIIVLAIFVMIFLLGNINGVVLSFKLAIDKYLAAATTAIPITFRASPQTPIILSISPRSVPKNQTVSLTVSGEYFVSGYSPVDSLYLEKKTSDGTIRISGTNLVVSDEQTLSASFDLSEALLGTWDIVLYNQDVRGVLANAFEVSNNVSYGGNNLYPAVRSPIVVATAREISAIDTKSMTKPKTPTTAPPVEAQRRKSVDRVQVSSPIQISQAKQELRVDKVIKLQQRLAREGLYDGPITGYVGPLTMKALRDYENRLTSTVSEQKSAVVPTISVPLRQQPKISPIFTQASTVIVKVQELTLKLIGRLKTLFSLINR